MKIKITDIRNAYFQGEPLDRALLLAPPRGGLPGEDTNGAAILARAPIYGTRDGGRGFWRKLRKVIMQAGMDTVAGVKSIYSLHVDGDVKVMMGTHVDDLIWACKPGYERVI